jgi:hypothetical protein
VNRYLIVRDGIYLKKDEQGFFDLLQESDLKGLDLCDIEGIHKSEICRTLYKERVFAVKCKVNTPKGVCKVMGEDKMRYSSYHAITCFEVKVQIVQISSVCPEPFKSMLLKLLGTLERIFSRGLESQSWVKESKIITP